MNRTEKFLSNSLSAAILQIVTFITGMITPRIMLTCYGSEINGLVSSILQFISYFSLVEAGLSAATVFALYKPLADNDYNRINSVVTAARNFYIQSGWIFVLLTIGLSMIYPLFVTSETMSKVEIGFLVIILGVGGSLEFFTLAKYRAILNADQKIYIVSLTSAAIMIINTLLVYFFSIFHVNIIFMRMVVACTIFLRSIILSLYVRKNYAFLNFSVEPDKSALNKRWDALYQQLLGTVQHSAPTVIITIFENLKIVSVYSIYNMILNGINGVLSIFISGLSSSFGELIARKDYEKLQKAYSEFECIYYVMLTVVYGATFSLILPFVRLYTEGVSDINYINPIYGFLFTLNGFLYNVKTPQGMIVISAGMYKETRWRSTMQALIIVIGGLILSYFCGLVGMMVALCLSNVYRCIDLLFFVPKYITKLPVKLTFFRFVKMMFCMMLTYGSVEYIGFVPSTYVEWFVFAVILVLYSLVVATIINFVTERRCFINVIKRIKDIGGKRIGKITG